MADQMGLGTTFTAVAATILCTLLTERVVIWFPLSILWRNTLEESVNMVPNDEAGNIGEIGEWCLWQRLNSVPHRHLAI